jgi:hypothetical protein
MTEITKKFAILFMVGLFIMITKTQQQLKISMTNTMINADSIYTFTILDDVTSKQNCTIYIQFPTFYTFAP